MGHVKLIIRNNTDFLVGNITNNSGKVETRGSADTSDIAKIIFNARVGVTPGELDTLVQEALNTVTGKRIFKQVDV